MPLTAGQAQEDPISTLLRPGFNKLRDAWPDAQELHCRAMIFLQATLARVGRSELLSRAKHVLACPLPGAHIHSHNAMNNDTPW